MFTSHRRAVSAYRNLQIESSVAQATPHGLIAMLYDGVIGAIRQGEASMSAGDMAAKGQSLTRAIRILDEGLKASLDPAGGEITENLELLYDYSARRLLLASARNDPAILGEVGALLETLRDAWRSIEPAHTTSLVSD